MTVQQEFEVLRRVPFFAEIEPSKLKALAFISQRVGFDDGKIVCRQGDIGDAAYLILEGDADIMLEDPVSGPVTVATLHPNELVGEMAILTAEPRNATVRARGRLTTLRIGKETFMRMVREYPTIAVSIMQELAHRVEHTNNQLRAARSEISQLRAKAPANAA